MSTFYQQDQWPVDEYVEKPWLMTDEEMERVALYIF